MSSAVKNCPGQRDLFDAGAPLPAAITVGPFGIAETWLLEQLQLTPAKVHAWHGDELGAPRDYRLTGRGYFYTAKGVTRILKLAGIQGVQVFASRALPVPSFPARRRLGRVRHCPDLQSPIAARPEAQPSNAAPAGLPGAALICVA